MVPYLILISSKKKEGIPYKKEGCLYFIFNVLEIQNVDFNECEIQS